MKYNEIQSYISSALVPRPIQSCCRTLGICIKHLYMYYNCRSINEIQISLFSVTETLFIFFLFLFFEVELLLKKKKSKTMKLSFRKFQSQTVLVWPAVLLPLVLDKVVSLGLYWSQFTEIWKELMWSKALKDYRGRYLCIFGLIWNWWFVHL